MADWMEQTNFRRWAVYESTVEFISSQLGLSAAGTKRSSEYHE